MSVQNINSLNIAPQNIISKTKIPKINSKSVLSRNVEYTKIDSNLLKVYYLKNSPNFCGTKSNYLLRDTKKGGSIPLIIDKGIDLRHYGDGFAAYPGLKVEYADFSNGKLDRCYLKDSEIINSNLTDTDLMKVHLHNSKLTGSNFTRAYAPDSVFKFSDFTNANLADIKANRSNFQGCNFANTDFTRGDFTSSNLMGADLSKAKNLYSASFVEALYDDKTKFPFEFEPMQHGMLKFEKNADLRGIYFSPEMVKASKDYLNLEDYSGINFGQLGESKFTTTLKRCNFTNLILDDCNFEQVDAEGASFSGCSLYGAKFKDANFLNADFHNAMFDEGTKFSGDTILQGTNLIGVDLRNSEINKLPKENEPLRGALYTKSTQFPNDFDPKKAGMTLLGYGQNLEGKFFSGMSFREDALAKRHIVSFENCNLKKCDFAMSDLCGLDMQGAKFIEAYLRDAQMKKTNCEDASFYNAKLFGADLSGANMKNTDLRWAKMQGIKIDTNTDFTGAKYNDDTEFPNNFPDSKKRTMVYEKRIMAQGY